MQRAAQGVLDVVNVIPPDEEVFSDVEHVSALEGENVNVRF